MQRSDRYRLSFLALASMLVASPLLGAARPFLSQRPATATSDSSDVVAAVAAFHESLAAGDSTRALAALAPDAVILESGAIETRHEYRAHHLPADIQFARAVPSTRTVLRVTINGDAAWITLSSVTQGQINGRAINSAGAELVVLRRATSGWQIAAIHWSSRARRSS